MRTLNHLPAPLEVIEINDDDNAHYIAPVNTLPLPKTELSSPLKVEPDVNPVRAQHPAPDDSTLPTRRSTRTRNPPKHFQDYLFTTVAKKIFPPSTLPFGWGYRRGHLGPQ
jgi:hypothetical protein